MTARSCDSKNIFSVYSKIFRAVLAKSIPNLHGAEEENRQSKEFDELILPSDEEWRCNIYSRLIEFQTRNDDEKKNHPEESGIVSSANNAKNWEWTMQKVEYFWKPRERSNREKSIASSILSVDGSMTELCVDPGWDVEDIVLAARILRENNPPKIPDEAQMRRIFSLVYDVLRHKSILNDALGDVGFWDYNSELKNNERVVWLLLYDMQARKFGRFGETADVVKRDRIFQAAGLKEIENSLLNSKTHLAASISRLRIEGSALDLAELLPPHLQNTGGVVWSEKNSVAFGWINAMKVANMLNFVKEMSTLGLRLREVNEKIVQFDEKDYVIDPLCPMIVQLHEKSREKLAVSPIVRDGLFVFMERSLCLGATALVQAIRRIDRSCGSVILTHPVAPRHTAYLAMLLSAVKEPCKLLAFGTGDRKTQYENYLQNLGITEERCRVFSERYACNSLFTDSVELDTATFVLASPPCSNTGVRDAVDLAVARGGDISLLEALTEITDEKGVILSTSFLTEQMATLKHALTRPNVQFLIYEAHSLLPAETTEMIHRVVDYANQSAREKHTREYLAEMSRRQKEIERKIARSKKSKKKAQRRRERKSSCENSEKENVETLTTETNVIV